MKKKIIGKLQEYIKTLNVISNKNVFNRVFFLTTTSNEVKTRYNRG